VIRTRKIAISLPTDIYKAVERERRKRKQNRSEFLRIAVEELLRRQVEREEDERYVEAYRRHPETPDDVAETRALNELALGEFSANEEPWET